MKNLRNCYAAFLLFALLSVSAAAPAQTDLQQKLGRISTITETRPLESTRFSEKYVTYFTQPLDHRRPDPDLGKGRLPGTADGEELQRHR